VLLNPVGSLRLSRAQKPNRYARAAPPDVSLPAIAARPLVNPASGTVRLGSMSESGVRREKAALSSGCKPHPANAPAGSNRSSYGGNEVAEAFGKRVTNW
jgi:hypothetical protein